MKFAPYTYALYKIIILKKKKKNQNQNVVSFQNGGQTTDFYFTSFRFRPNAFAKEFFNEIWLKVV